MAHDYMWYDGIAFPAVDYKPEILKAAHEKFVVKDEDIMLVSYPKSGTHWLIEILCLIHTKGDPKWVQSVNTYNRSPWIETESGNTIIVNRKEAPPLISSHLPIQLFPKSFFTSKAKLIYVIRNPKDVLISGYYFWSSTNLAKKPESLEQYFEWFLRGHVPYGSWFDHVRGWLSLREKENVLVLCYEEMRKDPRKSVEKICRFLGKALEPGELNLVLENSSFQAMKENKMSNFGSVAKELVLNDFKITRKGITGDWKNHFTPAQTQAFEETFREKMAGLPPELFPWD
ncbi:sulfotransferase 2A1-like [Perognathus longimembris pacificus]|uniref:sulfotransferase 2A1-like n=1 Tax=Perognathus longimembris pacificus TaxID=214514 RepID=UPI002018BCA1|nr:sulfotransferase 2A1-like [Perognathus longimembris pacificus]XP_048225356.1 sulfotransferase 2A1-like [Perognathus longimembris pacificus]XP_048225357.1 sulfotransferase 2A1-like [Perognathus longimembris pacificus]XP_048225358.1 sulfotransferase 2A1-like [Perognathus longimembris pacificus]